MTSWSDELPGSKRLKVAESRNRGRPNRGRLVADAPPEADDLARTIKVWPAGLRLTLVVALSAALWVAIIVGLRRVFLG